MLYDSYIHVLWDCAPSDAAGSVCLCGRRSVLCCCRGPLTWGFVPCTLLFLRLCSNSRCVATLFIFFLYICFLHRACPVYLCEHLFCSAHSAIEMQRSLFDSSSLNLCRLVSEVGWGVMSDIPGVPSLLRTTCWELQLWQDQTQQHQRRFSVV